MRHLNPEKLHVSFLLGAGPDGPLAPRTYTLTHSDSTGELFLSIGPQYNRQQVSGLYTRLMRDEVLAEWQGDALVVHCHVSGGIVFGTAGYRLETFRHHMPLVLEAITFGDRRLFAGHPKLQQAAIQVQFHGRQEILETWGAVTDWLPAV
jgi:hypothetical protein